MIYKKNSKEVNTNPLKNNKKANIQAGMMTLIVGALLLVVVAFILSSGSSMLQTQQSTTQTPTANCGLNSTGGTAGSIGYTSCGYAYNASGYGLLGLNTVSQQQPSVGSIVVLSAIVVILFGVIGYFATR